MAPDVTVVIPTKDRAGFLASAIATAMGQEEVDLEIVVVDDGSRDTTPDLLASIRDDRVRSVRSSVSQGLARARNRGIAVARGTWIAFLDDDDLWSPRKLRAQLDAAGESEAGFVYTAVVEVDAALVPLRVPRFVDPGLLPSELWRWNVVGTPSCVMVRASVLRESGGFDERMTMMEDWDLWLRLFARTRAAAVNEILVAYMVHGSNMSSVDIRKVRAQFEYLARKHGWPGPGRTAPFDGVRISRWIAGVERANGRALSAVRAYLWGATRYRNAGNVVRAVGALAGPRAMAAGKRVVSRECHVPDPRWLRDLRSTAGATPGVSMLDGS